MFLALRKHRWDNAKPDIAYFSMEASRWDAALNSATMGLSDMRLPPHGFAIECRMHDV